MACFLSFGEGGETHLDLGTSYAAAALGEADYLYHDVASGYIGGLSLTGDVPGNLRGKQLSLTRGHEFETVPQIVQYSLL
jgi:hypothetical protein